MVGGRIAIARYGLWQLRALQGVGGGGFPVPLCLNISVRPVGPFPKRFSVFNALRSSTLCCEDTEALGLALAQRVPPSALRDPPATLPLRVTALPVGEPLAAAVLVVQ